MQLIFSVDGVWPTPWMDRLLPIVATLAERAHNIYPIYSAGTTGPNAGNVATLLYALETSDA